MLRRAVLACSLLASSLLASSLLAHTAVACPARNWSDAPVTPDNTTLFDDGGVLIGMTGGRGIDGDGDGYGAMHLQADGKPIEVTQLSLGGGMSILQPTKPVTATLELVNGSGKVIRTYPHASDGTRLAAPRGKVVSTLSKAQVDAQVRGGRYRGIPSGEMRITLDADPPADALGLVVYLAANKQGIAFANVTPGQRQFVFYQGGKGCGGPGNAVALQRQQITLGWIDTHGRLSAPSRALTVGVVRP